MVLPYIVLFPLWLVVAIGFPLVQSLHAISANSDERKTWLFYWLCYAAGTWFLHYFEWLISIPFFVLSFYVDLYYEAQLALAFFLVFPKTFGIKQLQGLLESEASSVLPIVKSSLQDIAKTGREMVMGLTRKDK
mmetsp:Transcript_48051/g.141817  ORF Transcript_48051/g.141817 Transcript_48051/m.141817 type:complete len:134 (-) Transcript_48051:33-434(-)